MLLLGAVVGTARSNEAFGTVVVSITVVYIYILENIHPVVEVEVVVLDTACISEYKTTKSYPLHKGYKDTKAYVKIILNNCCQEVFGTEVQVWLLGDT